MISCSYNGWTDQPEQEREAIEAFEAARALQVSTPVSLPLLAARVYPTRKAA